LVRLDQSEWLYKRMTRKSIRIFQTFAIILLLALLALQGSSMRSRAQAGDPYSLIDAVNNLRVAYSLPAYQENSILMSIAQQQTDYQAAISVCTHTGAGGTSPKDRAVAAGYGGGATFFMSENFVCGHNLSVAEAIVQWQQDDPHLQTMIGANYQDVGAGVSVVGDFVYYTLDVAYVAGGGNYIPSASITPGGPTAIPIHLIQTSTPNPDGSVIHTVLYGQYLIKIAKAYGITLKEIMDLNNLTNYNIYEGDKLLIRWANTPGPTDTPTATITPTRVASPTRNPTRTPTPSASPSVTTTVTLMADSVLADGAQSGFDRLGNILVIVIAVMAVGGVILMVAGSVLKRGTRE
jgi:uncharacterized protein YkwD